ncbi:MAG: NAD(P)/FAD-dependent oxidoreductase [Actinobacteria bacterium]|nr:NAD(P)/FAD-dependent oxidoreductase [Actinomycetota bacterium]
MDYDAIVIGAGMGGCSAGAALAGAGKKVLMLEKTGMVGGRCSTVEKDGFQMDLGSHMLFRSAYGPFREMLRRIGKENEVEFYTMKRMLLRVGEHRTEIGFKAIFNLLDYFLPSGLVRFAGRRLLPLACKPLYRWSNKYNKITIQGFVNKFTDSLDTHNLFDWFTFILYGTPYWEVPVGELMRTAIDAIGPLVEGIADAEFMTGYIKGGLIKVPEAVCRGIEERGGEVRTNTTVTKITVEDGKASGVELENGELISCGLVISNAGIKETVRYLTGEEHFDGKYADEIRGLRAGCSAQALRLALDEAVCDFDLVFSIPEKDMQKYYRELWDNKGFPDGLPAIMATSPSRMDPSMAPLGKQSLIVIAPITFEQEENWPRWEQKLLDSIEDAIPGIKDHIIWHDFLHPSTYLVFGEDGAPGIGIAQCLGQTADKRPSSRSPVEGLYYVGCEAGRNVSGVATEVGIKSGLNCADYVLARMNGVSTVGKFIRKVSGKDNI